MKLILSGKSVSGYSQHRISLNKLGKIVIAIVVFQILKSVRYPLMISVIIMHSIRQNLILKFIKSIH